MGRVLQNKKRRAARPKVVRKPKSKKTIFNNELIRQNWDQKKTLSQNYKALGLTTKLNRVTGGLEKKPGNTTVADPLTTSLSTRPENRKIAVQEVRLERDPKTGETRIIGQKTPRANPLKDPLNELEESENESEFEGFGDDATAGLEQWNEHGFVHLPSVKTGAETDVVRLLERKAANPGRKEPRIQSEHEKDWCQKMVEKHGDDYEAMFRDMKLNVWQQSTGDIRRRIRKWKETQQAGG